MEKLHIIASLLQSGENIPQKRKYKLLDSSQDGMVLFNLPALSLVLEQNSLAIRGTHK
jgi:hypothetical protein